MEGCESSSCQKKASSARMSRSFLIHKPVEILSSRGDSSVNNIGFKPGQPNFGRREGGDPRMTVYDIAEEKGFPTDVGLVGRLDFETSGVMLFTDDQSLASAIRDPITDEAHPLYCSEFKNKEYFLQINPTKSFFNIEQFSASELEAELSKTLEFSRFGQSHQTNPNCSVRVLRVWRSEEHSYGRPNLGWIIDLMVTINEGKHHQIRRLVSRSHYRVVSLTRVRIAKILALDSVPVAGDCRWLTEDEIDMLYSGLHLT